MNTTQPDPPVPETEEDPRKDIRRWCFTLNNYTLEEENKLREAATSGIQRGIVRYIIAGKEGSEPDKTPHLQGYIEFHRGKTFKQLKEWLPRARFASAKGSKEQNVTYCSKETMTQVWLEAGKPARFSQGARNDLLPVVEAISHGDSMREMIMGGAITTFQGLRMAECLKKYFEPERSWRTLVHWVYGKSNSGKSYYCQAEAEALAGRNNGRVYRPINSCKFWEGYDGEEVVILEELRFEREFHAFFLRLMDRYPMRVETKGGSRQMLARVIYVNTLHRPQKTIILPPKEPIEQYLRRIDSLVYMENRVPTVFTGPAMLDAPDPL